MKFIIIIILSIWIVSTSCASFTTGMRQEKDTWPRYDNTIIRYHREKNDGEDRWIPSERMDVKCLTIAIPSPFFAQSEIGVICKLVIDKKWLLALSPSGPDDQ